MNETLRQSMAWLHSYLGLFFGWVLFGILLTGSIAVFYAEINLWAAPEIPSPAKLDRERSISLGREYLNENAPDARQWRIVIPTERTPLIRVDWKDADGKSTTHRLGALSGQRLESEMDAGAFFLRYHYTLGISRSDSLVGFMIVGAAGLAMLAAIVSGIIIHKRIFRDFFTFRPGSSRQRAWMDVHGALSVLPLPFHAMMAFTGLVILYYAYIPAGAHLLHDGDTRAYQRDSAMSEYIDVETPPGGPEPTVELMPLVKRAEREWGGQPALNIYISHPDRTNAAVEIWSQRDHRVAHFPPRVTFDGTDGEILRTLVSRSAVRDTHSFLAALHFVEWGGTWVRWLYFLAGLASTAMVATALVLFIAKREKRHTLPEGFIPIAKVITVAAVAGNIIACIAFLHAQRYYPTGTEDRKTLTVTVYFASWLLALIHAGLRPYHRAWTEQLAAAGILCLALPLAGIAAGAGLPDTIPAGDWTRAGLDLTAAASGALLVLGAWVILRKSRPGKAGE